MKNIIIINVLLFIPALLTGQKIDYSENWLNQLENPKYESEILIPENRIDKYEKMDFSYLFQPKTEFIE